jgi:hypothetical protein
MGMTAATMTLQAVEYLEKVIAIELLPRMLREAQASSMAA